MSNGEYQDNIRQEAEDIETFLEEIYNLQVPAPVPPSKGDKSFFRLAGIEASLYTISSMGAALFSAIRTGGFFYILETLLLEKYNIPMVAVNSLSIISMVLALLSFEGYLLADGYKQGKHANSVKTSQIGLWSAFAVIILAGVFAGTGLVDFSDGVNTTFNLVISLLTAVSSGVIVFAGGKNIGHTIESVNLQRRQIDDDFKDEWLNWRDGGVDAYKRTKYGSKYKKSFSDRSNEPTPQQNAPTGRTDWRNLSVSEQRDIIDNLTPEEIMSTYGVSRATAFNWKNKVV